MKFSFLNTLNRKLVRPVKRKLGIEKRVEFLPIPNEIPDISEFIYIFKKYKTEVAGMKGAEGKILRGEFYKNVQEFLDSPNFLLALYKVWKNQEIDKKDFQFIFKLFSDNPRLFQEIYNARKGRQISQSEFDELNMLVNPHLKKMGKIDKKLWQMNKTLRVGKMEPGEIDFGNLIVPDESNFLELNEVGEAAKNTKLVKEIVEERLREILSKRERLFDLRRYNVPESVLLKKSSEDKERSWKSEILLKKVAEYFQKLAEARFAGRILELEKEYPSEKVDEMKKIIGFVEKEYREGKIAMIENTGLVKEDFLDQELDNPNFDFLSLALLKLLGKREAGKISEADYVVYSARLEKNNLDFQEKVAKVASEKSRFIGASKYLMAFTFNTNLLKQSIFYTLDWNILQDAIVDVFGRARNKKEFIGLYRQYVKGRGPNGEGSIERLLEEHLRAREIFNKNEFERKSQIIPEETFPGEILHTDRGGNIYQMFTLTNPTQLEYEGSIVNKEGKVVERHCIGRATQKYVSDVKLGKGMAFSIRKNGVAGEILWTMWYDKKTKTIEQIKGYKNEKGNVVMANIDDDDVQATLLALAKMLQSKKPEIARIGDLQDLLKQNGTFLVYRENTNKIEILNYSQVLHLESGDTILSGKVKLRVDILNKDEEMKLLEKVLDTKAKINFTFSGEWLHMKEEVRESLMKLILKHGRSDMANEILSVCFYYGGEELLSNPNFVKIIEMSNGEFVMSLIQVVNHKLERDEAYLEKAKFLVDMVMKKWPEEIFKIIFGEPLVEFSDWTRRYYIKNNTDNLFKIFEYGLEKILNSNDVELYKDFLYSRFMTLYVYSRATRKSTGDRLIKICDDYGTKILKKLPAYDKLQFIIWVSLYPMKKKKYKPRFER